MGGREHGWLCQWPKKAPAHQMPVLERLWQVTRFPGLTGGGRARLVMTWKRALAVLSVAFAGSFEGMVHS